jgi:hypothetical protein
VPNDASTNTASFSPNIKVDVIGSNPSASPKGFGRSPTIAFPGAVKAFTLRLLETGMVTRGASFDPFVPPTLELPFDLGANALFLRRESAHPSTVVGDPHASGRALYTEGLGPRGEHDPGSAALSPVQAISASEGGGPIVSLRFIRRNDNRTNGGLGLAGSEDVTTFAPVCHPR